MKKIDFHIHTISTASDHDFEFSLERLKKYVTDSNLHCIAITNHNTFNIEQFNLIKDELEIRVFPGIEIDLEGGQLLLIGDADTVDDFAGKSKLISSKCSPKNSIQLSEFRAIYPDLSKYLIIPHYEKKPQLRDEVLQELSSFITAGEVSSPKKFIYCQKNKDKLVPLYFSDCRIDKSLDPLPVRQTFIDCDDISFGAIKSCLRDKSKVALSESDGNSIFQVFDNGQELSTGLNVVIGERSTGKSYTLDKIEREWKNVKYIKQFTLVARNEQEDERKFNKWLSEGHSLLSREHLRELEHVVNDIIDIDIEQNDKSVSEYLESLLKFAIEREKHDVFSKAKLFSEEEYQILDQKGLKELISSTIHLIENTEFRSTIKKYVPIENLKSLIVDLMGQFGKRELERLKKKWISELVKDVKSKLQFKTAATPPSEINLYKIAVDSNKVEKFSNVVSWARKEREIMRKPMKRFDVVARVGEFEGALELQKLSRTKSAFSGAFSKYQTPYLFLQELKNVGGIEVADIYRYFVKIEYSILNEDGAVASGGERSEFNLLQEVEDAKKYDILLIDEPESSFDNLFLKDEVNEIIKDLSSQMPVVLVTHNSTVGASIKPDYLLCTKKTLISMKPVYDIYSGFPTNKKLGSIKGDSIDTWEVMMGCLEAGETAYNERRASYEDLKN